MVATSPLWRIHGGGVYWTINSLKQQMRGRGRKRHMGAGDTALKACQQASQWISTEISSVLRKHMPFLVAKTKEYVTLHMQTYLEAFRKYGAEGFREELLNTIPLIIIEIISELTGGPLRGGRSIGSIIGSVFARARPWLAEKIGLFPQWLKRMAYRHGPTLVEKATSVLQDRADSLGAKLAHAAASTASAAPTFTSPASPSLPLSPSPTVPGNSTALALPGTVDSETGPLQTIRNVIVSDVIKEMLPEERGGFFGALAGLLGAVLPSIIGLFTNRGSGMESLRTLYPHPEPARGAGVYWAKKKPRGGAFEHTGSVSLCVSNTRQGVYRKEVEIKEIKKGTRGGRPRKTVVFTTDTDFDRLFC
ncbi:TPA_asm: LO6 [Leatherback sea turtle adomavirus]|nr:TPA_asm: LO6 [Leatherback sea turtle adomavirus]